MTPHPTKMHMHKKVLHSSKTLLLPVKGVQRYLLGVYLVNSHNDS